MKEFSAFLNVKRCKDWTYKISFWKYLTVRKTCATSFLGAAAKSLQSCLTLCNPIDGSPTRLLRPWDSPGKNTGVGCHFLLQFLGAESASFPFILISLQGVWKQDSLPCLGRWQMTLASTNVVYKFIGIKYTHLVTQPSPPSISRTYSFSQTETALIKTNSSRIHLPPTPVLWGYRHSTFCLYEFGYTR